MSESQLLEFLTKEFNQGAAYGSLNSASSAIALISKEGIGKGDATQRLFKGLYKLRPPKARYRHTWDPECVLTHLESLPANEELTISQLGEKTVTLLVLCTAHRLQTFCLIRLENIQQNTSGLEITITDRIKTSRKNQPLPMLSLPFITERQKVCVASAVLCYKERTSDIRNNISQLFITFKGRIPLHHHRH